MTDLTIFNKFSAGDFVEHRAAPNVVWEIRSLDLYTHGGPQATLRHVGGDRMTHEVACRVLNVYHPSASVCWVRDLREANPMLTLAAMAK